MKPSKIQSLDEMKAKAESLNTKIAQLKEKILSD